MAQKQFITYQSGILSFEAREAMLGVLNPGRYSGYTTAISNGAPSGGTIPILLQHTGGTQKLPKGGSSLLDPIGVVVTTQGVIIHEDQDIGVNVTDNNAGASDKYSLVYCEHEYQDGISGPNPATYGVINGTDGGGIPTLALAYKRSVVGVLKIPAGATTLAECTWSPRPSSEVLGDSKVIEKLFGSLASFDSTIMGTVPSEGIIGTRQYSEENFITSEESLSQSLNALDMQLKDTDDLANELDLRPLDSADWAPFSDITQNNASTLAHGLLPKLSGDADEFLNGVGGWSAFPDSLLASNNLADVDNAAEALNNLGGLTSAQIAAAYFDDSGWKSLVRSVAAGTSGFDLKIRRMGRLVLIQGTFVDGANPSPNAIIAQILLSNIQSTAGVNYCTNTKIYFQCGVQVSTSQNNRGMLGYIKAYEAGDTYLQLKVDTSEGLGGDGSTKFNINISFFADIL